LILTIYDFHQAAAHGGKMVQYGALGKIPRASVKAPSPTLGRSKGERIDLSPCAASGGSCFVMDLTHLNVLPAPRHKSVYRHISSLRLTWFCIHSCFHEV